MFLWLKLLPSPHTQTKQNETSIDLELFILYYSKHSTTASIS